MSKLFGQVGRVDNRSTCPNFFLSILGFQVGRLDPVWTCGQTCIIFFGTLPLAYTSNFQHPCLGGSNLLIWRTYCNTIICANFSKTNISSEYLNFLFEYGYRANVFMNVTELLTLQSCQTMQPSFLKVNRLLNTHNNLSYKIILHFPSKG